MQDTQTLINTKSHTAAILPVLVALNKFKEKNIHLIARTEQQKQLLSFEPAIHGIKLDPEQIKAFISTSAVKLNRFLEENRADIRFDELLPFHLGVVTIMDLMAAWIEKASEAEIDHEGTAYTAARIKAGTTLIDGKTLMIETKSDLRVFIELADTERSGLELFQHVHDRSQEIGLYDIQSTDVDVIVPFVSINEQPDISWLIGMDCKNPYYYISQALQQNKLTLNLDGVHAESAVAIGVRKCVTIGKETFIVNQPFNIWITSGRPVESLFPLFVAYVAPDAWQKKEGK